MVTPDKLIVMVLCWQGLLVFLGTLFGCFCVPKNIMQSMTKRERLILLGRLAGICLALFGSVTAVLIWMITSRGV